MELVCSKFAIMRPETGYVIVDDSPVFDGLGRPAKVNPGYVVAAYGETQIDEALAHLRQLLIQENADRVEDAEEERQALEELKAAAAEPETGPGTMVAGKPTFFDRPDDAEVR